jgi:hypothetical protein
VTNVNLQLSNAVQYPRCFMPCPVCLNIRRGRPINGNPNGPLAPAPGDDGDLAVGDPNVSSRFPQAACGLVPDGTEGLPIQDLDLVSQVTAGREATVEEPVFDVPDPAQAMDPGTWADTPERALERPKVARKHTACGHRPAQPHK